MKIKLRRILSFMLVIVLMLASGINALAWGGAGGVGQPTSGHGSGGNYPKSHGYGSGGICMILQRTVSCGTGT